VLWFEVGKGTKTAVAEDAALVLAGGVALHTSLLAEGRATIRLTGQLVTVFISQAAPAALERFSRMLAQKLQDQSAAVNKPAGTGAVHHPLTHGPLKLRAPVNLDAVSPPRPAPPSPPAKRAMLAAQRVAQQQQEQQVQQARIAAATKAVNVDELSPEQRRVFNLAVAGHSLFFSGGAGTGKSFVLRKILEALPREGTVATGPTGVAACNVGGTTLHAFSGIRPDGELPSDPAKVRPCRE
jgi:ATP-dependent DNA helicase PIF1